MRTQVSIALLVIGVVVGIGMGLTFAIVIPQVTNSVAQQQIRTGSPLYCPLPTTLHNHVEPQ